MSYVAEQRNFNSFADYTQLRKEASGYLTTNVQVQPLSQSELMPSKLIQQALVLSDVMKTKATDAQTEALATFLTASYPRFKVPNLEMYMFGLKSIFKQYPHLVGRHAALQIMENEEYPPTAATVKKWASGFEEEILEFIHVAKKHDSKNKEIEALKLENHEYVGRKKIEEAFALLSRELREKNKILTHAEKNKT